MSIGVDGLPCVPFGTNTFRGYPVSGMLQCPYYAGVGSFGGFVQPPTPCNFGCGHPEFPPLCEAGRQKRNCDTSRANGKVVGTNPRFPPMGHHPPLTKSDKRMLFRGGFTPDPNQVFPSQWYGVVAKQTWRMPLDPVAPLTASHSGNQNSGRRKELGFCGTTAPIYSSEMVERDRDAVIPRKKRRNNERRKEKSRDAARCRRGKESEIFNELGALLPLETPMTASLDKASVIRVAIAYLRTRSLVAWGLDVRATGTSSFSDGDLLGLSPIEDHGTMAEGILGALDGFLLVLTKECDIVYTSDNISTFLGLQQIDVVGHSLLDYTHPCDHDEARRLTALVSTCPGSVFLRFKCTLTPKGRNVNLKSASYKVVQVTGQVLSASQPLKSKTTTWEEGISSQGGGAWVVALGVPVPHPSNIEVPLDKQTFVSKHSLDMKFTYVDENIHEFCGYRPEDLLGRSLYQVNHALDTQIVKEAYHTLRSKGQVETGRYRFLSRGGGYVWVVTQATLITGHRDNKPQYVVCLNYVISRIECAGVIFSDCQLEAVTVRNSLPNCIPTTTSELPSSSEAPLNLPAVIVSASPSGTPRPLPHPPAPLTHCQPSPVAATCSLLRDRTEDMNEGYLTFADNYSHVTVLKEEPDDLTHLAPSVGEDCVPLDVPVFLPEFDDLLVETSASDFELSKPTPPSTYNLKETVDDTFTHLLHETSLSPQLNKAKDRETSPSQGRVLVSQAEHNSRRDELKHKNYQDFLQEDFRYSPSSKSSCVSRKVPEKGIASPYSATPGSRFDTPEPPLSPLLSQTSSSQTFQKDLKSPKPIPATARLFTCLDDDNSPDTTMDLLNSLDLKLEDDPELRAPYIPPIDEMLAFDQEDIFGLSTSNEHRDENRGEDGAYLGIKQKFGDGTSNLPSPNLGSCSPQHSFQQAKIGTDTGGSFVDPNQVLPGQCYIKEDKDNLQELRYLLEAPPPSPVREPVNPPPPLKGSLSPNSYPSDKGCQKRGSSPAHPTPTKKPRTSICLGPTSASTRRESGSERSWTNNQNRDLPTPNTPLMQQLLVSKDPICVRGRVLSAPSPSSSDGGRPKKYATLSQSHAHAHTHSVLRNLLVSGRDERAGYTVLVSSLSADSDSNIATEGNKSMDDLSFSPDSPLTPLHSFPLNKEGKVELTRQQLTALLDRAGVLRPSFRSAPPTPPDESPSPSSFSPATPSTPTFGETIGDERLQAQHHQESMFVVDSILPTSIPTLFDLATFDCDDGSTSEADSAFLQGSELLMALEQTPQQ